MIRFFVKYTKIGALFTRTSLQFKPNFTDPCFAISKQQYKCICTHSGLQFPPKYVNDRHGNTGCGVSSFMFWLTICKNKNKCWRSKISVNLVRATCNQFFNDTKVLLWTHSFLGNGGSISESDFLEIWAKVKNFLRLSHL